jgi:hypothetical protein
MAVFDPALRPGSSIPDLEPVDVQALGLMNRPTLPINIPSTSGSRVLVGGLGILAGYALRDPFGYGGQIFITSSAANPAAANNVNIPGVAGLTSWITGFEITGDGATAGSIIAVTLTGVISGTKTYFLTIPAGVGTAITPLIVEFPAPGIPASGVNTAITLNVPSFGAGNTNAAASLNGYQQSVGTSLGGGASAVTTTLDLLDGADANGEVIVPLVLGAAGTAFAGMGAHGPVFSRGLFLSMIAGSVRGAVYVKI